MTRRLALLPAVLTAAFILAGCASPQPVEAPASPEAPSTVDDAPLMSIPAGDANWECGYASSLLGIQFRSEWEVANGVIDAGEFDTRVASIVDAWTYAPTGQSEVTDALRNVIAVSAGGIGEDNPDFLAATQSLTAACDAAGSVIIVGALPDMGG